MTDEPGTPSQGRHSLAAVERRGGVSRLTRCRSVPPLKLLNPRAAEGYCPVILSSYGGGLVEGDAVGLEVRCGPGAALFLGTQALGKVYRCPAGAGCRQELRGAVADGGTAVVMPDPVVPFAGSIYRQRQRWSLHGDAVLLLVDGHTAGRVLRGERFAYREYRSDIDVLVDGRTVLLERYRSRPGELPPDSPGAFGSATAFLSACAVGRADSRRFRSLAERLEESIHPAAAAGPAAAGEAGLLAAHSRPREEVWVLRALADRCESLDPLRRLLGEAAGILLGGNPVERLLGPHPGPVRQ